MRKLNQVTMTEDEIKAHNRAILKKYGITRDIVLKGYIPATVTPFLREHVLRRDKFSCQKCGINGLDDLSVNFDIHRIIPTSKGGLNRPDNLVALCSMCHIGLHAEKRSTN